MARKNPNISISIDGEADLSKARKAVQSDLGRMEADAKDAAKGIDRAFSNLSPELDTSEIRKAVDLAKQLDGMVANLTVDADISEVQEAEKLAKALRGFQAKVDLSVEGRSELTDALGLAEKMDQIRSVKVQVQGRGDLERAEQIADGLERPRKIPVEVDSDELSSSVENAFDGIDVNNIADDLGGRLTGALAGAGAIGSGLALLGEAWGDDIMSGFQRGFNAEKDGLQLQIESGFGEADLRPIGAAAGQAYSEGFGESLHQLTLDAATLEASLRQVDESFDLTQATRSAQVLDEYLGVSIPESALLAARMIRQGLAEDTVEAYDIMTYATQQYGDVGVETLEITREFGGVIARLGIDGPAAIDFIARSYRDGLLPTIDRGGEVFEEFNIIMNEGTDDAREAVGLLNLDFDDLRAKIVAGGPEAATAMGQILTAMEGLTSETDLSTVSLALFGMTIESATDKREVIERLRALTTAQLDVSGASAKATEQAKEMQTEWDKASRNIENLASKVGGVALRSFNDMYGGIEQVVDGFGLWGDASDNISGQMEGLGDIIQTALLGPLGSVADDFIRFGGELGSQLPFWQSWWGEADHVGSSLNYAEGAMTGAREAAGLLSDGTAAATGELEHAKSAVDQLSDALDLFSGRFDEDQIMRRIEEDTIAATAAVEGLTSKAYELGTGFDITTEKGRNAQSAFEDLSGSLDSAISSFEQGHISGQTLADTQVRVESSVRQVAAAMGATQAETDELVAKYATVPSEVSTTFNAYTQSAVGAVAGYAAAIAAIPRTVNTSINQTTFTRTTAATDRFGRAAGGPISAGQVYTVGEKGPELFVSDTDGMIIPNDETRALLAGNPRARAMAGVGASAGGGVQRHEFVIMSDGSEFSDLVVRAMRKGSRNRGGVDPVTGRR